MFIKDRVSFLENYIKELCGSNIMPGATFALVDGEDTHINYFGKSQLIPKEKELQDDAIYDLASLTKVIATTSCIMMLIERGYFTLDTFIADILPLYKNEGVKIKHLLTHMSGHDADIDCKNMNRQQLIDVVYDNRINPNRFEKEVLYSDIGYIILGFIIEEITGSYTQFVKENLFDPLEMNDTFFVPSEQYISRCVPTEFCTMRNQIMKGIVHDEKSYVLGGVAGHAGLFSTAKDISNFVKMYIGHGEFNGKVILNKQTIDLILKCHTIGLNDDRGLGWWVKGENTVLCDFASDKTIYHSGFTGTSIIIDIDNKRGFILLTNRVHPTRSNNKLVELRRNIHNIALTSIK